MSRDVAAAPSLAARLDAKDLRSDPICGLRRRSFINIEHVTSEEFVTWIAFLEQCTKFADKVAAGDARTVAAPTSKPCFERIKPASQPDHCDVAARPQTHDAISDLVDHRRPPTKGDDGHLIFGQRLTERRDFSSTPRRLAVRGPHIAHRRLFETLKRTLIEINERLLESVRQASPDRRLAARDAAGEPDDQPAHPALPSGRRPS